MDLCRVSGKQHGRADTGTPRGYFPALHEGVNHFGTSFLGLRLMDEEPVGSELCEVSFDSSYYLWWLKLLRPHQLGLS